MRFPGSALASGDVVRVICGDDALSSAVACAAFGLDVLPFGAFQVERVSLPSVAHAVPRVAYVGPNPRFAVSLFWRTVREELQLGRVRPRDAQALAAALEGFQIESLLERPPQHLSGGETAKLILAAHALAAPDVLIADGLLAELDAASRACVVQTLYRVAADTVLVLVGEGGHGASEVVWRIDGEEVEVSVAHDDRLCDSELQPAPRGIRAEAVRHHDGSSATVVEIDGLTLARNGAVLLNGFSLSARAGDLVWVLGPNGSGKTTLFEMLVGWLIPERGTARGPSGGLLGAAEVAYSPQDFEADITELDMETEVALALTGGQSVTKQARTEAQRWCLGVGCERDLRIPLSHDVGARKLTSVLAALARGRAVCLLDEPTLRLSLRRREIVAHAIGEYLGGGGVVLCATHDQTFYQQLTSHVAAMR